MRSGFASALQKKPKYIIVMDADGSHNPNTIPRLLAKIEESGATVVVASRYIKGGGSANSLILRIMSRVLNRVYSIVLGINAQDVSNNYKIYRAEALRNIQLKCSNFDVVEEILLEMKRQQGSDFIIEEIPDFFQERNSGRSKRNLFLFMISYGVTLIRLRLRSII
jgi:dolichol-phosphate mannosyltransferase